MPNSVQARANNLVVRFADYVRAFDASPAFNNTQLAAHVETLALRSQLGSVRTAAKSPEFAASLRRTLEAWRMNTRRAKLVEARAFHAALELCADDMAGLENEQLELDTLNASLVADKVWNLIDRMRITETRARLVTCTKALHHLLPNLVVPMDRQFTGAFFGWTNQAWQVNQEGSFKTAFLLFADIARRASPSQFVGSGWNTNSTKVVDNAIVGFCRRHKLDSSSYENAVIARAKELGIYDQIVDDMKKS